MIHGVFRAEGLPLDLAYVALIESAFKPKALSRAKAKGVWQFMRGTAIENGLKHDWYIDERADPEKATVAAARYLKTLHRMFDGDWHLALASYNGGPGRVQRALKASGATDFWQLSASTRYLPRETREYVPMILAAAIIAPQPGALYGFEVVPQDPIAYEKVAVPAAIDLRRVAEWTGTSIDAVQTLNPELRRLDHARAVPGLRGQGARRHRRPASRTPPNGCAHEFTAFNYHTVKRGESLVSVASRFKVGRAALAEANGLSPTARLRVGQELIIPRGPAPAVAARAATRPAPARAASASPAPRQVAADGGQVVYEVRRGDTLFGIARLFETTVDAIKRWNRLRTNRIVPGDRLTIYASRTSALQ
jgi:membrane-bound lytic murein transglycosylase D